MPLTKKGQEILANMKEHYGAEEGERVFYASKNAGKIKGVDTADAEDPVEVPERRPDLLGTTTAGGPMTAPGITSASILPGGGMARTGDSKLRAMNEANKRFWK